MEEIATYGKLIEKECKRCKLPKAISEYQRNIKSKDGHLDTCKACMYDLRTEGTEKKRKEKLKTEANEVPIFGFDSEIVLNPRQSKEALENGHSLGISDPSPENNVSVVINFKDYPEVYGQLKELAYKQVRTIEQQALFYVARGLSANQAYTPSVLKLMGE